MTQGRLLGGRYQVGELLGYGGMAEVHRGRDLRLGRDVAIKLLRADLARDDTFQLRFRREAQNAAALNHPAIVAVYDTGEERAATGESLPYIVMEFVNGHTLKEVLGAEGRMSPRRALDITAEICSALEFSHRHGIIHRDIKPGNVMLTQTGQVKVMDFGIARALASGASTMTQTSAVIGTAQYLSPEQARGESVDARSDVYATGCVLYELICGHPPFVGDSPVSVAYQHVREDPKPPSLSNRDVAPPIDAVVLKALAKNPLNRYQSAAEMRADVLRAAAGRPVLAEPVLRHSDPTMTQVGRPGPGGPGTRPMLMRFGEARHRSNSNLAIASLSALGVLALIALVAGIIIAQQPDKVAVPSLVGKPKAQADKLLSDARLTGDPQQRSSASCVLNTVLEQSTAAATSVAVGTKISYVYCVGPGNVTIPAVLTLPVSVAQSQLEALKLTVKVELIDSEKPADTVVEVIPAVGDTTKEGGEVVLKVSKGNWKVIPAVAGLGWTEGEAKAALKTAGFNNVKSVNQNTDNPEENGKVLQQDPAAGTAKDPAAEVRIFIGRYNAPSPSDSPSPTP